jgi:hypothetical protein
MPPLDDPWAAAADAMRAELARRERQRRDAFDGLSRDAVAVIVFLHVHAGRAFLATLHSRLPRQFLVASALDELREHGLIALTWAVDEQGDRAELVLSLEYGAELPPPATKE